MDKKAFRFGWRAFNGTASKHQQGHKGNHGHTDADDIGDINGHAEAHRGFVADIACADRGNEYGRRRAYPVEAAAPQQEGRAGPEHDCGQGLVGEAEVAPDNGEIHLGEKNADCEHGHGNVKAGQDCLLVIADGFRNCQTGGAEGRVTGCDWQDDDAQNCKDAAKCAHKGHGGLGYDIGRAAIGKSRGKFGQRAVGANQGVEGHADCGPDQADEAFRNHAAVKDALAKFFIGYAAGHKGRLRCMEAGKRAAGNGDEDEREDRQALGMEVGIPRHDLAVELIRNVHKHHDGHADGHDAKDGAKNGIEIADNLVDGHDCGNKVIGKDHADPECEVHIGWREFCKQARGRGDKDHADQDEQDNREDAHDLLEGVAKVVADNGGHVGALVANGKHPGHIVMHRAGKDAADNDPDQGRGTPERAEYGAEDGAHAGDVQ